jgi:hypothetical protein
MGIMVRLCPTVIMVGRSIFKGNPNLITPHHKSASPVIHGFWGKECGIGVEKL